LLPGIDTNANKTQSMTLPPSASTPLSFHATATSDDDDDTQSNVRVGSDTNLPGMNRSLVNESSVTGNSKAIADEEAKARADEEAKARADEAKAKADEEAKAKADEEEARGEEEASVRADEEAKAPEDNATTAARVPPKSTKKSTGTPIPRGLSKSTTTSTTTTESDAPVRRSVRERKEPGVSEKLRLEEVRTRQEKSERDGKLAKKLGLKRKDRGWTDNECPYYSNVEGQTLVILEGKAVVVTVEGGPPSSKRRRRA
jgi:hypothetical protein